MGARRSEEATAELRDSLLNHAAALVRREGARSLTMRALASEARCSIGLPYKVFENREALIADLVDRELRDLNRELERWAGTAGTSTVARNLDRFASLLLESDTPALIHANDLDDAGFTARVARLTELTGLTASFHSAVADYLKAEQRAGRVRDDVDCAAYGFLITGAIHNLLTVGEAYPSPSRPRLRRILASIASSIVAR